MKKTNIKEVDTKTYAGVDAIQGIKKDPRFGALSSDAKMDIEQELKAGGTVELEENPELTNDMGKDNWVDDEGRSAKSRLHQMVHHVNEILPNLEDNTQLPDWIQSKLSKASDYLSIVSHYLDYENKRGQEDLMEHLSSYKKQAKRAILMEGAMKKFFEDFDNGKTNEEIIQDYASRGTQVPEAFVSNARRQYEGYKKLKLELEISEKEFKNSARDMVNNPKEVEAGIEMGEKKLASGITQEKLDPVGQEDDDINNDGKVDKTDKYLKNKREKISKAIKSQK